MTRQAVEPTCRSRIGKAVSGISPSPLQHRRVATGFGGLLYRASIVLIGGRICRQRCPTHRPGELNGAAVDSPVRPDHSSAHRTRCDDGPNFADQSWVARSQAGSTIKFTAASGDAAAALCRFRHARSNRLTDLARPSSSNRQVGAPAVIAVPSALVRRSGSLAACWRCNALSTEAVRGVIGVHGQC